MEILTSLDSMTDSLFAFVWELWFDRIDLSYSFIQLTQFKPNRPIRKDLIQLCFLHTSRTDVSQSECPEALVDVMSDRKLFFWFFFFFCPRKHKSYFCVTIWVSIFTLSLYLALRLRLNHVFIFFLFFCNFGEGCSFLPQESDLV